jgi:hypothetical protein
MRREPESILQNKYNTMDEIYLKSILFDAVGVDGYFLHTVKISTPNGECKIVISVSREMMADAITNQLHQHLFQSAKRTYLNSLDIPRSLK